MIDDFVILVNKNDKKVGLMSKMEAHVKGVLHRAFSVFIFNDKKELMLQKRNISKYHSPGLWTNTCCSHQKDGESNIIAGKRRLLEEMGFCVELKELDSFIYNVEFDNGLIEHELDYILVGRYNGSVKFNSNEVDSWKWMSLDNIIDDIKAIPENYTEWFKIIMNNYYYQLKKI
ncbi:MAG TPA: isopentenyl-diphosphate Delta-isomerase [Flavobacteriaceae bacterium]|nr:isopentenyl-diphosphate Delta-isomerase [Flavobacteriaceae bacterium]|tara:strand:- start:3365 stop:3886 length:522 start_codon:yes stop_codon:yes gene_type:complete